MDRFEIKISKPILDRKSKFIGVSVMVTSKEKAEKALNLIKNKKEFKKPSHSITAYRILQNEKVLEKKNDDGETGAGIRLLELLRKRNIENILVIVFRWYGGIHLGSDRFRHILSVGEASLPED